MKNVLVLVLFISLVVVSLGYIRLYTDYLNSVQSYEEARGLVESFSRTTGKGVSPAFRCYGN